LPKWQLLSAPSSLPHNIKQIFFRFDTDDSGSIDNNEFLHKLGTELAPGDEVGLSSKIAKGNTIALQMLQANQRVRARYFNLLRSTVSSQYLYFYSND